MIKNAIANIARNREVPYTSQATSPVFWDTSPVCRLYDQVDCCRPAEDLVGELLILQL
jgi:hypothetical protein